LKIKYFGDTKVKYYVHLICLAFLLCAAGNVFAQPKIEIPNSNIDVGRVNYKNSPVARNVIIKNVGTDTLHINEVKAGCGCTVTDLPDKSKNIAPGDSASFGFQLDISRFTGKTTKSIRVSSNDPTKPNMSVVINCDVERPFEVKPKYLSFDRAIVGTPSVAEVDITNTSKSDAVVKSVSVDNKDVIVNLNANDVLKKGETFKLKATAIATKKGSLRTNVKIELYHPDEEFIDIFGYGNAINKPASEQDKK
jgi:hypothetical protein